MTYYLVSEIYKSHAVRLTAYNGKPVDTPIELSWHDGMIGAMPVFTSYADALKAADGKAHLIIEFGAIDEVIE